MTKNTKNKNEYKLNFENLSMLVFWTIATIGCLYFWGWVFRLIGDLFIYLF